MASLKEIKDRYDFVKDIENQLRESDIRRPEPQENREISCGNGDLIVRNLQFSKRYPLDDWAHFSFTLRNVNAPESTISFTPTENRRLQRAIDRNHGIKTPILSSDKFLEMFAFGTSAAGSLGLIASIMWLRVLSVTDPYMTNQLFENLNRALSAPVGYLFIPSLVATFTGFAIMRWKFNQ